MGADIKRRADAVCTARAADLETGENIGGCPLLSRLSEVLCQCNYPLLSRFMQRGPPELSLLLGIMAQESRRKQ